VLKEGDEGGFGWGNKRGVTGLLERDVVIVRSENDGLVLLATTELDDKVERVLEMEELVKVGEDKPGIKWLADNSSTKRL